MGLLGSVALRGGSAAARHILQLEDRRAKQLNHLTRAVNAVLEGPYKAGIQHLKIAANVETSGQSAAQHLANAEGLFVEAFGNLRDVNPLQGAWAAVHLAVICMATERRSEGLYWAELAQDRATAAADLAAQELTDRAEGRVGRLRLTSENSEAAVQLGGAVGTGVGVAAAGVTIASGGTALVIVGAAIGATMAVGKGMEIYRSHQLKKRDLNTREISDFLSDIGDLKEALSN
jgi:hypothetical protein